MTLESTWSGVIVLKADNLQLFFFFLSSFFRLELCKMNAIIACLISNLSMNSDSVSFSFVHALLICYIQLYMTLPFLFPFLCVFHSNSETLFLYLLAPWCRIHFPLSFMSHFLYLLVSLLLLFCCCELSQPVSLLGLGLDLSIACAILPLAYSNDACRSDNLHLRASNLLFALLSFGKVGGEMNLFYTLEGNHSPSKIRC